VSQVKQIVIASNNRGKLKEIEALFVNQRISIVPQSSFDVPDADETGLSFVENAIIKARHAATLTNLPAIADDSGIEVDVLNGAPGIYSARYAGAGASDEDNLNLLLENVKQTGTQEAIARFQCVMVYLRHEEDSTPLIAEGTWRGHIVAEPKGDNGFGYDPIFYVPEQKCTSAELPAEVKNKISHRGQALQLLMKQLFATLQ
jgi:XTP/dITP diphosphohydrolase